METPFPARQAQGTPPSGHSVCSNSRKRNTERPYRSPDFSETMFCGHGTVTQSYHKRKWRHSILSVARNKTQGTRLVQSQSTFSFLWQTGYRMLFSTTAVMPFCYRLPLDKILIFGNSICVISTQNGYRSSLLQRPVNNHRMIHKYDTSVTHIKLKRRTSCYCLFHCYKGHVYSWSSNFTADSPTPNPINWYSKLTSSLPQNVWQCLWKLLKPRPGWQ